jgi:biopolymer transport protein ExbD
MIQQRRRRAVPAYVTSTGEPIAEVNTTPLIDVMLVLLIMFIITIPLQTHAVKMDLPSGPPPEGAEPETHKLAMDGRGALSFDGAPVAEPALGGRLAAMQAGNPLAILHFQVDGQTRHEDFDRVLAQVKKAGVERLGFVGNERFAVSF